MKTPTTHGSHRTMPALDTASKLRGPRTLRRDGALADLTIRTRHIDPHRPAARHFDEILGYHYYTELAHSTGMPVEQVAADLDPDDACSQPRPVSRSHRLDGPVFVAAGDRPDLSSFSPRSDHAREHRRASRARRTTSATARSGTARSGRPAGSKPCFSPTSSTIRWTAGTRRLTCRACGPTTWS